MSNLLAVGRAFIFAFVHVKSQKVVALLGLLHPVFTYL